MKSFGLTILLMLALAGCARFKPQTISPAQIAASFDSRDLSNPRLRNFLERNLNRQFDQWPLSSWDFETLNLAALYYHPSLDVARAQWTIAVGENKTAAQHPNPTASVTPGYDISAAGGLSPWLPAVTFDVPIETAGKRGYRMAQARHLSDSARLNIATTAWQVRSMLRSALLDWAAAKQKEALLQKQKTLQDKAAQSLEQQLQAGAVSRSELTTARVALNQLQLDLLDSQQQRMEALGRVAEAIGVSAKALQGIELKYDFGQGEKIAGELSSAEARQQALVSRADILGALAEFAARQSGLQLEIAKQYPDIHLGPGYQFDQGDHKFSLSVTAELPLFNQNQGPIAEAEARRAEAAAQFIALQAKVIGEIDRAVAAYQLARENMTALETLVTSQNKRRESIEQQSKAGAVAPTELLNLQIELGATDLLQLAGRIKLEQALAALENALQRPIESMQPRLFEQSQRSPAKKENTP